MTVPDRFILHYQTHSPFARKVLVFGHPSGTLRVGADVKQVDGRWVVTKAVMSRSARVLMEGTVRIPGDAF